MAAGALAAWSLVLLLAALAMRRRRRLAPAAGRRMILAGGVALPTTLLVALLVYGTLASDRITGERDQVGQVVQVTARQWQWDFAYLDRGGQVLATSTDALAMPLGTTVEFRVDSEDVIHSFWIPRLGGKIDAIPGRTNVLRLRADQAGPIRGQCAEFCGLEHALMAFDVTVLEPAAFAGWLAENAVDGGDGAIR
ncbi:cytochrome c oxidase subunit II [Luteimonas sp. SDU101]|uniref:cytochrome c oxidase subunit II n=1 Tax=Luteimonas sp. SDU101 TaxID=3422593 RepID=UPI003EB6D93C